MLKLLEYFYQNLKGIENTPAVWIDVPNDNNKGKEKRGNTGSLRRKAEVEIIIKYLKAWILSNEAKDLTFGVISFYGDQVKELKSQIKSAFTDKEQNIFKPKVLQRLLSNTGKKENLTSHNIVIKALKEAGIDYTYDVRQSSFDNVTKATINKFNKILFPKKR